MKRPIYLGIDLGSVSLKAVVTDADGGILFEEWTRVKGAPMASLGAMLEEMVQAVGNVDIDGIGITGSGRGLLRGIKGSREVNEITAHAKAAHFLNPTIRTIIEIGGQDSKLIILDETGEISDFAMNELCAAGTGAFLDQQAARLSMPISEFAALVSSAKDPVPIAGRCAVFAKTDMTHHQQEGRALPDIVAGLNDALVRSYISNLVRGKMLPRPISFQGGVASNGGLLFAFRKNLGLGGNEISVPRHHLTMGAFGAAILAKGDGRAAPIRIEDVLAMIEDIKDAQMRHGRERLLPIAQRPIEPNFALLDFDGNYLGIDIGSVSVKAVLLGKDGITRSAYAMSDGRPLDVISSILGGMLDCSDEIDAIGITGSGRGFIGAMVGADVVVNEITAQAKAASFIWPECDTVIEIGGQDAKFMRLEDARATDFQMNRVCAAGTGAFLQEQAVRLGVALDGEFANEAFLSERPADLGARCTVFMESDLVSHQQMGYDRRDLVAGLSLSVVTNYLEKVVAGRNIGKNVLFLGGVAENDAVASALKVKVGCEVRTCTVGKISGAIGAAIAAREAIKSGLIQKAGRRPSLSKISTEQFICDGCSNRCKVTRLASDHSRTYGGRCGKWETSRSKKTRPSIKNPPVDQRMKLLFKSCPSDGKTSLLKIGIPRAMLAFDQLPLWRKFFVELGHEVVLSPETDDEMLTEGLKHITAETCLPIKTFAAHVMWFERMRNVDYLFIPSMVMTGKDVHGRDTYHCPYVQSLVQFARPITSIRILNPVVSWKWHPMDYRREMIRIASDIGAPKAKAARAFDAGLASMCEFKDGLLAIGNDILSKLRNQEIDRAFVLIGKDYNICDVKLNSRATDILHAMGETAITQDMMADDSGQYPGDYSAMIWPHGKEIIAAAHKASGIDGLYPIMLTSFGCGPDSFTINAAREASGGKPFLVLEVDEHSSSIGMETRIEAFLDSIGTRRATPQVRKPSRAHKNKIRRVFLPSFSDHGLGFAAVMKKLGFTPVLTGPPDATSEGLGLSNTSCGECHPYTLMLGDYIKAASSGEDFSDACYFMPDSALCRVGQFGAQMRRVADVRGLKLPISTNISELYPSMDSPPKSTYMQAIIAYWEAMRGMDFLMQKHLETRAYEVEAGSADKAHEEGLKIIFDSIMEDRQGDGIKRAVSLLDGVKTDRARQLVKIGITGDYYTRVCDFANGGIFRDVERMGGVIMLPPTMSEFVKYDAHQKLHWAVGHKNLSELCRSLIARAIVGKKERGVRALFGDGLDYDIPLEYGRAIEYIRPYMDKKLPSGLTASVAAIMEQISAGADGILNLITFHCTYGLILCSVMSAIAKDHPDIPRLTLIFEGLKPTHNRQRLEAFMERVKSKRLRR
jgi:predicted CoA-substrate-specific enzyme activase